MVLVVEKSQDQSASCNPGEPMRKLQFGSSPVRSRVMFKLEDKIPRARLTQHFCFVRPSKDCIAHPHWGGPSILQFSYLNVTLIQKHPHRHT